MATICARIINLYKFNYHLFFSPSFYKIIEEDQGSDETEIFINFNINHNFTGNDINDFDVKSQL